MRGALTWWSCWLTGAVPPLLPHLCPATATGFPGESDEAHRELVDFVREFRFERMGAFAYSEEDGTPAADLPEQVPPRKR